jgi:hypothetical protein
VDNSDAISGFRLEGGREEHVFNGRWLWEEIFPEMADTNKVARDAGERLRGTDIAKAGLTHPAQCP